MRAGRILLISSFWFTHLLLTTSVAPAQPEAPELREWQERLVEIRSLKTEWEHRSHVVAGLTLTVALFGVAVSTLQRFQKKWCAQVTGVIGVAISIITVVNNQYYQLDHRTYQSVALDAEELATNVERSIRRYLSASSTDREALYIEISEKLDKFVEIKRKAVVARAGGDSVAYAEASKYADESRLQFTGVGVCNSFAQAKENSAHDAIEKGAVQLRTTPQSAPAGIGDFRAYVTRFAKPDGTDFNFDATSKLYRYTTVIQLGRGFAGPSAIERLLKAVQPSQEPGSNGIRSAPPRLEAVTTVSFLPTARTPQTRKVHLVASDPKDGDFSFEFALVPNSGKLAVALSGIEVQEDASGGSTRWAFEILVDGKLAFDVPMQRYDDSEKPTRCSLDYRGSLNTTVDVTDGRAIELKVRGFKPKDL